MEFDYDAIVIGAGAAGAVYISKLAAAGLRILAIEKGPHYRNHKQDFFESELAIFKLLWDNNQYKVEGKAFRATPNLGQAVGGGTLAWTAVALRFFEHDFKFASNWGIPQSSSVADWPIEYKTLARHYDEAERVMGVSGSTTAWDLPKAPPPPNPPIDLYRSSALFKQAFERLGMNWAPGRIATNSVSYQNRSSCLHCGHCRAGCRVDAKYQADKVLIEPALRTGLVTLKTESLVTRLETTQNGKRISAVNYLDLATGERHQASARFVIVCNNPIETPRLLLSSTNDAHPFGIGNQYDQVGRHFFCHLGTIGLGTTGQDLRMSVGHNMGNIMSLDFCEDRTNNGYSGGYTLLSLNGSGAGVAALDPLVQVNGHELKAIMKEYNNSLMLLSFIEGLPSPDNRITLVEGEYDQYGMPLAKVTYNYLPNDLMALQAAQHRIRDVLYAADASNVHISPEFEAHPMGTMRMGNNPHTSVTNSFGKVHGVNNLYIGGASLFVTGSSVNPTLTIHALALRSCEKIVEQWQERNN
ncbi:GMC family oxidoreductase [Pseudoalteromonas piscicida]|uniref:GMC family oxidoreductase n=1 Tax=Pseudoalteromonas piscicida TaxID=43662 RepID=A0AAD0RH46_PSEO7|nr:GMC family oxidoreductase [Pseudoalteromonas piscicida]AXR01106.1 GMC family oxidoreductase [Pseudoalteromonas piscicida]